MATSSAHVSVAERGLDPASSVHVDTNGARSPSLTASVVRIATGLALILHGLGHAVLASRGAGAIESTAAGRAAAYSAGTIALCGFVAGGLGLIGVRPLDRAWRISIATAATASLVAVLGFRDADLATGVILDCVSLWLVLRVPFVVGIRGPARTFFRRYCRFSRDVKGMAFFLYIAIATIARPWHREWGSTALERAMALAGDTPDRDAAYEVNHAITIAAPAEAVWPWIAQIGQDRGGFYSYDWLERLIGARIHNANSVHPEWQDRRVSDLVRPVPRGWFFGAFGDDIGWRISAFEPNRALVLKGWGAFVLLPQADGTTRLIARGKIADRHAPVWGAALSLATFELEHFIMQRQMLLGIRDRGEILRPDPRRSRVAKAVH